MTGHAPFGELSAGDFPVTDHGNAVVPAIQPDMMETIMGNGAITFQTLHEIQAVEQKQTGYSEALIIPLRHFHDRQKIFFGQAWPGIAYINKRSDKWEGHA